MRRKTKLALLGVAFIAGLVLVLVAFAASGKSANQKEIEMLRQAGLPTSPAELDKWYVRPPDSENAALLVEQAIPDYVRGTVELSSTPTADVPISATTLVAFGENLEENRGVLEKLEAAARLKGSRYSINLSVGAMALLPHLSHIKELTFLLGSQAVVQSAKKDYSGAARSLISGFALARTLRNEPILISELVRIACVAINVGNLEYLMSQAPLTAEELGAFEQVLEEAEADGRRGVFRAMAGERAGVIQYFTSSGVSPGVPRGGKGSAIQILVDSGRKALGIDARDLHLYLEMMGRFTNAATNDYPEMLRAGEQTETEFAQRLSRGINRFATLTRAMTPALSKAFAKEAALDTWIREARVAIAVEQYRLAHNGTLPPNLDALTPKYLTIGLVDAAEGKPFEFKVMNPAGYQITSPAAAKRLKNTRETTFTVRRQG